MTLWVQDEAGHIGERTMTVEVGELTLMEKINNYRHEEPAISYGILILLITIFLVIIITLMAVRRRKRKKRDAADVSADGSAETEENEEGSIHEAEKGSGEKWSAFPRENAGSEPVTDNFFPHPPENETMTSFFESETGRTTGPEEDFMAPGPAARNPGQKEEYVSLEETYENLRKTLASISEEKTTTENYSLPISTESTESMDTPALLALPQGKQEDRAAEDFGVRVVKYPKEGMGKTKKKISKKGNEPDSGSSEAGGDAESLDGWDI